MGGVFEDRRHTLTGQMLRQRQAAQLHQRRIQIDQLCEGLCGGAGVAVSRKSHNQRDPDGAFKQIPLLPEAMLAKVVSVIGHEYNDGVVGHAQALDSVEQAPHLRIHERDRRIVGLDDLPALIHGQFALFGAVGQRSHRDVIAVSGLFHHRMDIIQGILFKVGMRRYVGRVRPVKTNGQE